MKALRQACMMLAQSRYNATVRSLNKEVYAAQAERRRRCNRVDSDLWNQLDEMAAASHRLRAELQAEIDALYCEKCRLEPDSPEWRQLEIRDRELRRKISLTKADTAEQRIAMRKKAQQALDDIAQWYDATIDDTNSCKEAAYETFREDVAAIAAAGSREQLTDYYHALGGIDMPADEHNGENESAEKGGESWTI